MPIRIAALALALVQTASAQQYPVGRFTNGPIRVEFLNGGPHERRMRLLSEVKYVDPAGKVWTTEVGYITDGATIPQPAWSIVGGPFDGPYRDAAIVHDKYCDTKTEPYRAVHRMFYRLSRT